MTRQIGLRWLMQVALTATLGSVSLDTRSSVFETGPLAPDDPAWTLVNDEAGVEVFLRNIEGSSIEAFQGRTRVKASLASILAVMDDPAACPEWVHQCTEARFLEGDFTQSFHYGVNDFPWPADDRDYVLKIQNGHDPATGGVHRYISAVEGHVDRTSNTRVTQMKIHYFLIPISETETQVTWTQHTDPGGLIPGWMVNMLLVDIPRESLRRLEATANQDRYRNTDLVRDSQDRTIGVRGRPL